MRLYGRTVSKMFGYRKAEAPELDDLELVADSATLRRLAAFFAQVADQIDADEGFDHAHLLDAWNAHGLGLPDVVVTAER